MDALTFGCCLSASTVAIAKNGRNDSFTPSAPLEVGPWPAAAAGRSG
jgi:hypothetical protein